MVKFIQITILFFFAKIFGYVKNVCYLCITIKNNKTMTITQDFLETKFAYYNAELFGGIIPTPRFKITRTKNAFGTCTTHVGWGYTITISISTYYDRSEMDFCNTLVHEMIHAYLYATRKRDKSHGYYFLTEMERINSLKKYGLNITVKASSSLYEPTKQYKHNFFCYKRSDGTCWIFRHSRPSRTLYSGYLKILIGEGKVKEFFHFKDNNKREYNSLPTCRENIRACKISEQAYNRYREMED